MTTETDIQRLAALYRDGAFPTVVEEARAALCAHADSLVLHEILAAALMAIGKPAEAAEAYRAALRINPAHAPSHFNLGCALYDLGADEEAAQSFRRALAHDATFAKAHERLGALRLRAGDGAGAIAKFEAALAADQGLAAAHDGLGLALQRLGRPGEAVERHRRAVALNPQHPLFLNNLGVALQSDGDDRAAIDCFKAALRAAPVFPEAHNNIAVSQESLGRLDEARAHLAHAIEARPDYAEAHRNLSRLTRYKPGEPHIATMQRAAANPSLGADDRAQLGFALAKALIDIGENDAAFDHLEAANRLRRSAIRYDPSEDAALFDNIKGAFGRSLIERPVGRGFADDAPIFIVGMPRSGTTLAEQILASHPLVHGAGELNLLNSLMLEAADFSAPAPPNLEGADFRAIGETYVGGVRARGAQRARFTDKAPLNFRWIGAIRLALPNAKVVHCARDARDACFSIYRNYFATGGNRYAYDLAEIGRFYRLYSDLTAYWKTLVGGFVYDLDYERLVADQVGETRRLLEFCGLDFDAACLAFEKTERPVKTVSAAQVREPLNDSSIGIWRRFESRLGPLLEILADAS